MYERKRDIYIYIFANVVTLILLILKFLCNLANARHNTV